jgi:uncharacterized protein DUF559/putative AbiEi antitoxin of type IV toxin-antitoxin system
MQGKASTPPDEAIAAIATAQGGVASLAQLRGAGLGDGAIEHRARTGRLHRIHRGVYAVGHPAIGREGRAFAAVLACGRQAWLSHASAGAWWDLRPSAAAAVDVLAETYHRHAGIRLHRSRALEARDTTSHRGLPITSVARTVLDLAATLSPHHLERTLAHAERLHLYDHAAILDVLARNNGHRGTCRLAAAIAHQPAYTRSDLEARVLHLIRAGGLPEPQANRVLTAPDHPRLEVDLYWPAHRLIVETDGYAYHRTRADFETDRRRDAALTAAGYKVLRFTARTDDITIRNRLEALLTSTTGYTRLGAPSGSAASAASRSLSENSGSSRSPAR